MSYPDVIHAGKLRQGDRIHLENGTTRKVLATFWKPGYSFIRFLVEGEPPPRSLSIGHSMYVVREAA